MTNDETTISEAATAIADRPAADAPTPTRQAP